MKKQSFHFIFLGLLCARMASADTAQPELTQENLAETSVHSSSKEMLKETPGDKMSLPATANTPVPAQAKKSSDKATQSPYSYQATEQISEDLSVAFPVDI
ncbi:MAG: hypothetical protein JKY66_03590 [Spongiibacteraceae bacterium]|nr:hypothetical protein [Spongiibacteraceae bacterium]